MRCHKSSLPNGIPWGLVLQKEQSSLRGQRITDDLDGRVLFQSGRRVSRCDVAGPRRARGDAGFFEMQSSWGQLRLFEWQGASIADDPIICLRQMEIGAGK